MRLRKLVPLTSILLLLCSFAVGQAQPAGSDAEKEKKKKEQDESVVKMLEQSVSEAGTLKLASNRAVVFALSADLLWKLDEKRARKLFGDSATEIITYLQELDKQRRDNPDSYGATYERDDLRDQILPLVAKHDGELALTLLLNTRPAKLAEAMAKAAQSVNKSNTNSMRWDPEAENIRLEIALEQRFAFLAADENPDRAAKLIKDSITKGISSNVLPLLQKLNKKDEKKAAELGGDVIKKLIETDLEKNLNDLRTALDLLQYAFQPEAVANSSGKPFKFSEDQGKALANKIADAFLQPSTSMRMAMTFVQVRPLLEKTLPERADLIRQRGAESFASLPAEMKDMLSRAPLWDKNSTPEEILAQIGKLSEVNRQDAYEPLVQRILEVEDEGRAKRLIDQIPDEKVRAAALEQFETKRIARTASAGKLDEARKMIGNLTKKSNQIKKLVALATEFQRKGGEKDLANAKSLMKDAKALTSDAPETDDDIDNVMEVVRGYATVDADTAFRIFEPIIDQINDFIQASSVLARFDIYSTKFRKGELLMKVGSGNGGVEMLYRYIPHMQLLAKADLDRMNAVSERFARADSQMIVRLYALQGFLKDPNKADEPGM